jgi:hypothetical protein
MAAGLTLDSGALIAAEKASLRFRAIWKERQERGRPVTLPAVVLAQVWRGNRPVIARHGADIERLVAAGGRQGRSHPGRLS